MLFAYISPETMWPVMSIIAGAVGTILMFGRNVVAFGRRLVRGVLPGPKASRVARPGASEVGAKPTVNTDADADLA
ncbi:MAG: hypothetical protein ACYC61_11295 [Isosphaeraceae bacterium]